ncbi:divergent polysaccharide deacetylase family protein [Paenibacillus sp. HB172176]|uniref:divergent polysaccharide deacetylase family protein n=1 Tax=Paenibacillus sp. HB172176 TaxID=2493690 RepID=UPI00143B7117
MFLTTPVQKGFVDFSVHAAESETPRTIAIVIDDFGNGMKGTEEMLKLPIAFTAAIMPFMPTTQKDAEAVHKLGHDIIVHMPMEPNKGLKSWLGPGALTVDLNDEEIRNRVEDAIANVPYAIGMNNHMGSKVTADERVMRIVLKVCKEHGMFFLDSRTTFKTVIPKIADELGVPYLSNNVFLDDVYTASHVSKQVELLKKHIDEHDQSISIGHVGPPGMITSAALKQNIPSMKSKASFVRLSDMVRQSMGDPLVLPNP